MQKHLVLFILDFFPYTPNNHFFFLYPNFFFLGAQTLSIVFLHHIFFTPHFFSLYKRFKHSAKIFPPSTWVETINSTLVQWSSSQSAYQGFSNPFNSLISPWVTDNTLYVYA